MNISNQSIFNRLEAVSTATISGVLHQFGITSTFIVGPTSRNPGSKIAGKAVTLRFMPKREDKWEELFEKWNPHIIVTYGKIIMEAIMQIFKLKCNRTKTENEIISKVETICDKRNCVNSQSSKISFRIINKFDFI